MIKVSKSVSQSLSKPPLEKGGTTPLEIDGKVSGGIKKLFFPYNTKLLKRARDLRNNMTEAEKEIWYNVLRNKSFTKLRFLRQRPIGNFIVDFYCAKLKLVLEIDGDSHAEQEEYDTERTSFFEGYGIKVIRFNNSDILQNLSGVYEILLKEVRKRQLELSESKK